MPNWCLNNLELSHPDPAMLEKAVKAWNDGGLLSVLVPEPDYSVTPVLPAFPDIRKNNDPVDPEQAWWDWRVVNWGTKWDVGYRTENDNRAEIKDGKMVVFFESAWSPPTEAYKVMEEHGFEILAYYDEPGIGFCGKYSTEYGDETYSYDESIPEDVAAYMFENPEGI